MRTEEFMSFREAVVIRWRMQVKADFASDLRFLFTIIPFPVLFIRYDAWKFINLEFLICRRLRIIISPLFEWNIFTDNSNFAHKSSGCEAYA